MLKKIVVVWIDNYGYSSVFNLVHQQDWEHIVTLGIAVNSTECSTRSGTHRSVEDSIVFNRALNKIGNTS